jgi:hypothetical protein
VKPRFLALTVSLLPMLGLGGCFTGDQPLFTDEQAVAPYTTITFTEHSSPGDKTILTRDGKAYVAKIDGGSMTLRFMPIEDDLYLTESAAEQDGKTMRLYAVVKLDANNRTATAYKAMAGEHDSGPGLTACKREDADMVCVDDVNAYVALAKAAIASGGKPDMVYDVTLE